MILESIYLWSLSWSVACRFGLLFKDYRSRSVTFATLARNTLQDTERKRVCRLSCTLCASAAIIVLHQSAATGERE